MEQSKSDYLVSQDNFKLNQTQNQVLFKLESTLGMDGALRNLGIYLRTERKNINPKGEVPPVNPSSCCLITIKRPIASEKGQSFFVGHVLADCALSKRFPHWVKFQDTKISFMKPGNSLYDLATLNRDYQVYNLLEDGSLQEHALLPFVSEINISEEDSDDSSVSLKEKTDLRMEVEIPNENRELINLKENYEKTIQSLEESFHQKLDDYNRNQKDREKEMAEMKEQYEKEGNDYVQEIERLTKELDRMRDEMKRKKVKATKKYRHQQKYVSETLTDTTTSKSHPFLKKVKPQVQKGILDAQDPLLMLDKADNCLLSSDSSIRTELSSQHGENAERFKSMEVEEFLPLKKSFTINEDFWKKKLLCLEEQDELTSDIIDVFLMSLSKESSFRDDIQIYPSSKWSSIIKYECPNLNCDFDKKKYLIFPIQFTNDEDFQRTIQGKAMEEEKVDDRRLGSRRDYWYTLIIHNSRGVWNSSAHIQVYCLGVSKVNFPVGCLRRILNDIEDNIRARLRKCRNEIEQISWWQVGSEKICPCLMDVQLQVIDMGFQFHPTCSGIFILYYLSCFMQSPELLTDTDSTKLFQNYSSLEDFDRDWRIQIKSQVLKYLKDHSNIYLQRNASIKQYISASQQSYLSIYAPRVQTIFITRTSRS